MQNEQIAFVELDALLDTRLATVHSIDEHLPYILLQNGYRKRLSDKMDELSGGLVNQEDYRMRYARRDMSILALARPTDFLFELRSIAVKANLLSSAAEVAGDFKIILNKYPYAIPEEDHVKLIKTIQYYMGVKCAVEIVSMSPSQCGPAYLKRSVGAFFIYNFDEWLRVNALALAKNLNPQLDVLAPAIFKDDSIPSGTELILEETGESTDFFQITEAYLCPAMSLSLIDIKYFSVIELNENNERISTPTL